MNELLRNIEGGDLKQIDIVKMYHNKKCLIIDDFPTIRGSLSRTLKTFGAEAVETAANGEEAVRLCSKVKYDIVLCDYNLGAGKDGQQILEEVRFLRVLLMTSLFVMITGESSREMVLGALECQPDDYITKPYTQASLKVRLDKAIIRHEALLPIKRRISNGDYGAALNKCNEMIKSGSRYSSDCIKMKGHLHFLLKQLKEARAVYESVLDKKPVVWAKLGMSKTLIELGRFDAAEELLQEIIDEDERYIEAHDLLADVYQHRKDNLAAQRSTENATRISPKSALRHRRLAKLAELNHDSETSLKSYQQAIKWGLNSCHESEQDYFNYARKASEMVKGDDSTQAKTIVKQANNYLDRARKRFSSRPDVLAQAQMVETQVYLGAGNKEKAEASAKKAKVMYSDLVAPPIEASLEYARSMTAMGDEEGARELLTRLAARHENDPEIIQIIDSITGEPITHAGKKIAATLTKEGISSYEGKAFTEAISVFNKALEAYPRHVGLNLNLLQAMLSDTEHNGYNPEYLAASRRCIRMIGEVPEKDKQYKRLAFIKKQLGKHYPEALSA